MSKSTLSKVLAVCLITLLACSAALAQPRVEVASDGKLVSVQATNTSARSLAEALSEQLGIAVVVTGNTESPVTIDIVDEPLEKALAKLTPNYMLVRADKSAQSEIVEIVLIMEESGLAGSGQSEEFLPSGSPAEEIIDDTQPVESAQPPAVDGSQQITGETTPNDGSEAMQTTDQAPSGVDEPAPKAYDPATGLELDPETGLPIAQ